MKQEETKKGIFGANGREIAAFMKSQELPENLRPLLERSYVNVKIKKLHPDAVIPTYAHDTDCGMDLTAVSKTFDEYGNVVYGFGLAFEIPKGYAGFIFPRSSNHKSGLLLTNSVGVIDAGYRGEVTAKFASRMKMVRPTKLWDRLRWFWGCEMRGSYSKITTNDIFNKGINYNIGDRVAQMVILPYPKVECVEVDELSDTERGAGGYGSTGK